MTSTLMNTPEYQQEELNVYNQLIDGLLDSVGFTTTPDVKLVFYLGDTLAGESNIQNNDDLIADALKTRSFSIDEINKSAHKFVRATDTLKLNAGEQFTSRWLKLTRVRFNKDLTKGFLRVGVWCGNMCSWEGSFNIRKAEGRWRIVGTQVGPPA